MCSAYINLNQMEDITENILKKSGIPHTWQGSITKIDIDSIIEFDYGLDISWENIDYLAKDGIVLAAIIPQKKQIYLNLSQEQLFKEKMGTLNFSMAHELGHWVLHVTKQRNYEQLSFIDSDTYFCRSSISRPPEEIQADMFASSILMPKNIITEAINELKNNKLINWHDLYEMKDAFGVSISALTTRIKKLKLLYIDSKEKKIYHSEEDAKGFISIF